MEVKIVTTINGERLPATKCKYIKGYYFKKGRVNIKNSGDCYRITNKNGQTRYRTVKSGVVVWDDNVKKYVHKSMLNTISAIVGPDMKVGNIVRSKENVICIDNRNYKKLIAENKKVAIINGFKEKLTDGLYYLEKEYPPEFFTEKPIPSSSYKSSLDYSSKNLIKIATQQYEKLFSGNSVRDSYIESIYNINPELFDKFTFGVEFETTRGMIPQSICDELGLMPLRDGSITGIEYATIPLTGKKGLYTLKNILQEINYRTEYDFTCSMHVHVGGFGRTSENILALFKAMYNVQSSVYDLFPLYKFKNMGVKRKNYTSPLPDNVRMKMSYQNKSEESIKEDLHHLIYFLSGNSSGFDRMTIDEINSHPYNPSDNRKWNMTSRYLWFNLIPVIFTNKETAEYRIFEMPNNFRKLIFFLVISLSLTEFATKYKEYYLKNIRKIEGYNLGNILRAVFPHTDILQYLRNRTFNVSELTRTKGTGFTEKDIQ